MKGAALLRGMLGLEIPPKVPGVYFAWIEETGEVKIGRATDIRGRLREIQRELRLEVVPKVVAVAPGYTELESDFHAKLYQHLSRKSGPLVRELYRPEQPVLDLISELRQRGLSVDELRTGVWRGPSREVLFDDGERLILATTYLPFIEEGHGVPRYVLESRCSECRQMRPSTDFLNDFKIEALGARTKRWYVVLKPTNLCMACTEPEPLPTANAFPGGVCQVRIGGMPSRHGEGVQGYDRKVHDWLPINAFGIRRMAKAPRAGHANDHRTMRLQPYSQRQDRTKSARLALETGTVTAKK